MKKNCIIFIALSLCATVGSAVAEVTIKKAAPVATQESATSSVTTSLVPSVLTLVSDVQSLNAKQRDLNTECTPSSAEIEFVNNTIKEWAKTGAATAEEVERRLNKQRCAGGVGYEASVRYSAGTDMTNICYDNFAGESDKEMVWYGFPKASKTTYCPDGSPTCSEKERKTVSNIYEIFDLVDFTYEDYNIKEATMAAKLIDRADGCSTVQVNKKKKQMWGEFLVKTMGNVGQKTSTSQIMETVSNITQNGSNLNGGISSLGAIATQFMDK